MTGSFGRPNMFGTEAQADDAGRNAPQKRPSFRHLKCSLVPTASGAARAVPPNRPSLRPHVARRQLKLFPCPACRATPSAGAEPLQVIAGGQDHPAVQVRGE